MPKVYIAKEVNWTMLRQGSAGNLESSRTNDGDQTAESDVVNGQNYTLYPNPSDGNITLKQMVPDAKPVNVAVYNATGMSIYKHELTFSGQTAQLHAEYMVPGLYLLKIRDSEGRTFMLKFVIDK